MEGDRLTDISAAVVAPSAASSPALPVFADQQGFRLLPGVALPPARADPLLELAALRQAVAESRSVSESQAAFVSEQLNMAAGLMQRVAAQTTALTYRLPPSPAVDVAGRDRLRMRSPTVDPYDPAVYKDLRQWLFMAESVFRVTGQLANCGFMEFLPSLLKGSALPWFRAAVRAASPRNAFDSWELFSAAICMEFEPLTLEATLLNRFRALRQTGSVQDYTADFQSLLLQLPPLPEVLLLSNYLFRLSGSLRGMVGQFGHGSLREAAQHADCLAELRAQYPASSSARRDAPPGFSHPPAHRGAQPMELGAVVQSGEWEMDEEEGEGHFEPKSLAVARAKVLLGQTGGAARICKRCQQPGHISIDCRMDYDKLPRHNASSQHFQQPPRK